jgi:N-methylhydantoinase A
MNMRYAGQNWALTFDIKSKQGLGDLSFVDDTIGPDAVTSFNKRHMEEYGHVREGETPEVIGVRLVTHVDTPSPRITAGCQAPRVAAKPVKTRRANLGQGFKETRIYRGADLKPGNEVVGPAIIEESFTTIVVYPDWNAYVDDAGDYELIRA